MGNSPSDSTWNLSKEKYQLMRASIRFMLSEKVHKGYSEEEIRVFLKSKGVDDDMF